MPGPPAWSQAPPAAASRARFPGLADLSWAICQAFFHLYRLPLTNNSSYHAGRLLTLWLYWAALHAAASWCTCFSHCKLLDSPNAMTAQDASPTLNAPQASECIAFVS